MILFSSFFHTHLIYVVYPVYVISTNETIHDLSDNLALPADDNPPFDDLPLPTDHGSRASIIYEENWLQPAKLVHLLMKNCPHEI